MTTGCTTKFKFVQPVVTYRNKSYYQSWNCCTNGTTNHMVAQSVARPVPRLGIAWSCAIDGTTLHDWSHDNMRHICDLLRFITADPEFWTWPPALLRPNLLVRSPTTSKIKRMICQCFNCDSSYLWSYGFRNMVASPVWLGLYEIPGLAKKQTANTLHNNKPSVYIKMSNKNIKRYTAHTIVSWPNFKQRIIVHTSDLVMTIRQIVYSLNHHEGNG